MKNILKTGLWILFFLIGCYIGKILWEPEIPVSELVLHPQQYAGKSIKTRGIVNKQKIALSKAFKVYLLCDETTGDCIPVKTDRIILPATNQPLRIRASLSEPWSSPFGRQLLLTENKNRGVFKWLWIDLRKVVGHWGSNDAWDPSTSNPK